MYILFVSLFWERVQRHRQLLKEIASYGMIIEIGRVRTGPFLIC